MADALHEQVRDVYIKLGFGLAEAEKATRDFFNVFAAVYRENNPNGKAKP